MTSGGSTPAPRPGRVGTAASVPGCCVQRWWFNGGVNGRWFNGGGSTVVVQRWCILRQGPLSAPWKRDGSAPTPLDRNPWAAANPVSSPGSPRLARSLLLSVIRPGQPHRHGFPSYPTVTSAGRFAAWNDDAGPPNRTNRTQQRRRSSVTGVDSAAATPPRRPTPARHPTATPRSDTAPQQHRIRPSRRHCGHTGAMPVPMQPPPLPTRSRPAPWGDRHPVPPDSPRRTAALGGGSADRRCGRVLLTGCAGPGVELTAQVDTAINAAKSAQSAQSAQAAQPDGGASGPNSDADPGSAGGPADQPSTADPACPGCAVPVDRGHR